LPELSWFWYAYHTACKTVVIYEMYGNTVSTARYVSSGTTLEPTIKLGRPWRWYCSTYVQVV
jgi:IS1 family transposase